MFIEEILLRQSITHFWRFHLALMFGVAVATAILSGAMIVGDSVSGSLRSLSLERIGNIDVALINNRFFDEQLADRIPAHL
ncbi:MAG: hypothetical protein R3C26_11415 [Calditrichia bacterium]